MYELPPILTGSSAQQIAAIRAYLVRMADRLNEAADAPGVTYTQAGGTAAARQIRRGAQSGGTAEADAEAMRRNAAFRVSSYEAASVQAASRLFAAIS